MMSRMAAPQHDSHGSTPASWATVGIMFVAFVVGALAVITLDWWLGAIAVGLLVLGAVVGRVLAATGYGKPLSYNDPDAEARAAGRTQPGTPDATG